MNWLLSRLKEKSTWLSLFAFASLFGMQIEPELKEYLIQAVIGVAALVAFIFKEKPSEHHQSDQIPPIELQSRSESAVQSVDFEFTVVPKGNIDRNDHTAHHQSGYRLPMQSKSDDGQESGWNGWVSRRELWKEILMEFIDVVLFILSFAVGFIASRI